MSLSAASGNQQTAFSRLYIFVYIPFWAIPDKRSLNVVMYLVETLVLCRTVRSSLHSASFLHQMKHFCCGSAFLFLPVNVWNQVPEWNFFKLQPSFRLCKLASGVPVNVVMALMLMLAQVNAFHSRHHQTLIKHSTVHRRQVEYEDSPLRWI